MYKEEFTDLVVKGLKEGIPAVLKEYGDEDIYILSLEADNTCTPDGEYTFTLYVNTEENHKRNLENACDDPWYYRFCEYEWYIIPDPEFLNEAVTFLTDGYASMPRDEVYECFVQAIEKLREEKFFDNLYPHFVFFSINASECFDEEGMIDFAIRMNGKENCKDYIENIEAFF
ncbi:MAG: DUF4303 domain-containing protein [Lachnospiraceae bacterium]|nr:DUF4303 domain-containing protein [Lachnospiraceae bacterium]